MPFKNREEKTIHQRNKRHEYKNKLNNIKNKIGSCQICGWNNHIEILQFHHKIPEEKSFNFSDGNNGNKSWKIIEKEINKCILICPNCHLWLHYKEKDKKFVEYGKRANKNIGCSNGP